MSPVSSHTRTLKEARRIAGVEPDGVVLVVGEIEVVRG